MKRARPNTNPYVKISKPNFLVRDETVRHDTSDLKRHCYGIDEQRIIEELASLFYNFNINI